MEENLSKSIKDNLDETKQSLSRAKHNILLTQSRQQLNEMIDDEIENQELFKKIHFDEKGDQFECIKCCNMPNGCTLIHIIHVGNTSNSIQFIPGVRYDFAAKNFIQIPSNKNIDFDDLMKDLNKGELVLKRF